MAVIAAPPGTLTLGAKRRPIDDAAPHCPCGSKGWVLVGSMTEYYSYTRSATVCRVGDHPAASTQPFVLYPRGPSDVLSIHVNVCPDHVETLHASGIAGFFPRDEAERD